VVRRRDSQVNRQALKGWAIGALLPLEVIRANGPLGEYVDPAPDLIRFLCRGGYISEVGPKFHHHDAGCSLPHNSTSDQDSFYLYKVFRGGGDTGPNSSKQCFIGNSNQMFREVY
jgi:hypothetical protein